MSDLTPLEKAVLLAIADQLKSPERESLVLQVADATVTSRENTGAGFYTHFELSKQASYSKLPDLKKYNVEAEVGGILFGFILWTEDYRIDFLEGYMNSDNSTGDLNLEMAQFKLIDLQKKYLS